MRAHQETCPAPGHLPPVHTTPTGQALDTPAPHRGGHPSLPQSTLTVSFKAVLKFSPTKVPESMLPFWIRGYCQLLPF